MKDQPEDLQDIAYAQWGNLLLWISGIVFVLTLFVGCAGVIHVGNTPRGGWGGFARAADAVALLSLCGFGLLASWVMALVGTLCGGKEGIWLLIVQTIIDLFLVIMIVVSFS